MTKTQNIRGILQTVVLQFSGSGVLSEQGTAGGNTS